MEPAILSLMEMNQINLAVRFVLEVVALISVGIWGWKFNEEWTHYALALGIPIVLAVVWGTFNVPDDPSRSGSAPVIVSGVIRLVIELGIFSIAAWALYNIGYTKFSLILVLAVVVHYLVSYERVMWLLAR